MKKGVIKASLVGFFILLLFGVIFFSLFSSAYSSNESMQKNSTLFNFEKGNIYLINTVLKFDLNKLGNYELIITKPSGERISRVSSNDRFSIELLEQGKYSVSIKRGNGKSFYDFLVIPYNENNNSNNSNNSDEDIKTTPVKGELVQEKAEINKPVAWTLILNETLIALPNSTNVTLSKDNGEPFLDYNLTNINGKSYIQIIENVSENITLEYFTEPPKLEEKIISENKKEVIISSPEDVHYEEVLAYTEIPEKLWLGEEDLIEIYWKENNTYINFNASDKDDDGLLDYVEWIVPHLSEQTFEIILIIRAEHLSSNKTFISDIYGQVKELDNIWSETINSGEYVRVVFERTLNSTNDITIYPNISFGIPTLEVYEKDKQELIAKFENITSNEYNKVYLTNLIGEQDTFDLKVVGGSLEFDHIIDPTSIYNMNPSFRAYWGRPTSSNRWQAGTNSTSAQYTALSTEDTSYARNVMPGGTSNDYPFYRFNFTINELPAAITSIYVKFTGYDNATEAGTVYVWRFGNSTWMPIGTTPAANGNVTRNFTSDISNYLDANNQFVIVWQGAAYDAGDAVIIDEVRLIVQYNDIIPPTFTSIPANSSLFYGNESLGVDFDATDEIEFGNFSVNDTRFSINQTGFLSNSTPLTVGNYTFNITINDTSNNLNWTFYKVQVNKSKYYNCAVYFNTSSPITYPETFIAYTNCSSDYTLYLNGTSISNGTLINYGAGYYNFTVQRTDTQNYTSISDTQFFTVNQNPENCWILYNETSPLEYPSHFSVWANCTTSFTLYRNGTEISNNSEQALGVSAYNFSLQRIDTQNYSINYNQSEFRVVDTTFPLIEFGLTSPKNNSKFARTWIYVDASVTEANEKNITFNLYFSNYTILNSSTYTDLRREINWTNLLEGIYYFNITVADWESHFNTTETRKTTLNFTIPNVFFVYPTEDSGTSFSRNWIYANVSVSNLNEEINISFELYNTSSLVNKSVYTDSRRQINWTSLPDTTYYYNVTLFDNPDGMISTLTRDIILDTTPPYFTYVPENSSLFYGNESLYVDFDAEDNIAFGYFSINDTEKFSITQAGVLENATVLGIGNYLINVTINDTLNHIAWIVYKIQINKSNEHNCAVYFNTSSPITYPETFIAYTNCSSDYTLYLNGTSISNGTLINYGAGYYNFTVQRTDTQNYTSISDTQFFTVNQNPEEFSILFNTSSPIIYPETFRVWTNATSEFVLYRNGTTILNNSEQVLAANTYNFSAQRTDTSNYSFNTNWNIFTVDKNPENCWVLFNETSPLPYPNTFLVWTNCTTPFTLYRNGTEISNDSEQILPISAYNFSFQRTDTENYSINYNESEFIIYKKISSIYNMNPSFRAYWGRPTSSNRWQAGTNSTSAQYTALSTEDTSYARNAMPGGTGNDYPFYRFNFTIEEDTTTITSIYVKFTGYDNATEAGTVYVWRFGNSTWMPIGTTPAANGNVTRNFTSDISNYLDANKQFVIVWQGAAYDAGDAVIIDHVQLTVLYTEPDTTPPYFTTIPSNSSLFYGNESLAVNFEASDNYEFGDFSVNDTRFSINSGGLLTNSTPLTVGNYTLNITINDTSNNLNWTFYKVQVNKSKYYNCAVYFNTSSPITYPETFIAYTNCSSDYTLYLNGTSISNGTLINYGAGYYNFTVQRTDTQNYTSISDTQFFTVNQNPEEFSILFNTSSPIIYPETFRVWTNATSEFVLYRNGTTILNNSEQVLAANTYNFSAQRTDTSNYSFNTNWNIFTVDKNPENCWVLFNETSPLPYPNTFLVWTNCTTPFTLYRNGTEISNDSEQILPISAYNFSFQRTDTENYSINYNESEFIIIDIISPYFTTIPSNSSLFYGNESIGVDFDAADNFLLTSYTVNDTRFSINTAGFLSNSTPLAVGNYTINITIRDAADNINWTFYKVQVNKSKYYNCAVYFNTSSPVTYPETFIAYTNCSSGYSLYRNGTSILNNSEQKNGAGYYNFTVQRTDTQNYTSISDTQFFTVNKNPEEFSILFNTSSPIIYPETFHVWTNATSEFVLYRNGTTISNNSEQKNGAGYYNFSAQRTDTSNYSFNTNWNIFTIDKNPENCWVLFNETSPLDYPGTFLVWANCTTAFTLYRNGTLISNNSEQVLNYGAYNFSMLRTDYLNYSIYYNETEMIITDTVPPLINYIFPTRENNSNVSQNWIYVNISVIEDNFKNITFDLYYINNTLLNSTTFTDATRSINFTLLQDGKYLYNVTIFDLIGNMNYTFVNKISLDTISPLINIIYPEDNFNFSGYSIPFLNYSVNDTNELFNCTLYGTWNGGWHPNQTTNNPIKESINNFSYISTEGDGYYLWNVKCEDNHGNIGWNSTNYTFSTFLAVESLNSSEFVVYMTSNDARGNVFLSWNNSNHTEKYRIYSTEDPLIPFSILAETYDLNYTDLTANETRRRFYKLSALNPISENISEAVIGKTVYYLKRKDNVNTRNWMGFYLQSNLTTANQTLIEINNLTSFTMWNSTIQKRVTCNTFSCPDFPSCTETNCNFSFGIMDGFGFESTLNSSSPIFTNWSTVGLVKSPTNISLVKNSTSSGKNWISIYYNSSWIDASDLMNSLSYSDAVTNWNELNQKSEGWILSAFPFPIGENFILEPEKGYEASVTDNCEYIQS